MLNRRGILDYRGERSLFLEQNGRIIHTSAGRDKLPPLNGKSVFTLTKFKFLLDNLRTQ